MQDEHSLRAEVQRLNDDALCAVMSQYGIVIPAREAMQWRATKPTTGTLKGFGLGVTILCTNGVTAYFLLQDGRVLYGHVSNFDGKIEPRHGIARASTASPKSRPTKPRSTPHTKQSKRAVTQASIAAALELLKQATEQHSSK